MAAAAHLDIAGAKGGESKPKTPVEAPDSLRSTNIAKILLAVGEGEFEGTPTDRDIYLDNTPIVDGSGNLNFPGVKWEWRPGSVEQEYIQGIPSIENETTVNVELRSDNPFTRTLSNTQLSAFRVRFAWPRLVRQDSNGNTNGYRIEYAIEVSTDGGAFTEALRGAVDGKTTNGYQRSERVNLPAATSGWAFRVRRLTQNANTGLIADTMTIAGYTEIIDQKLRYPNTALLYIEFDAEQFQNIPAVTVKCKAQRWPVPSNYDPVNRTYSGVWDGTFKQAWTNNPVWATYGICINDRFGLGKRIQSWMVDKWEMYRIGQYCDQQVSNGVGGMEPRYLCDLNLQGKAEAWTLLRDLSAIYRGMVYWAQGSLYMQADMPRAQDIDYTFTRSNVIDGDFVYGGAGRDTHYSRALISYDNPANNYDTDVIPVTDNALQRRYRDRPIEISAIGCTRASEAQRRGKWALLSNNQDRTVTFKTGMEGANVLPGFVIPVADELVAGRPNGGRISAVAGRTVTLDRDAPVKAGDRLIVNLPNGTAQARTVQSVVGRRVTVTTAYTLQPEPQLQWAVDYSDLAVQLFRVLKRKRTAEGEYEFTALEFNPSKFAAIDSGAKLDERPISVIPVTTVPAPDSVTLTSSYAVDQGIAVSTMTIEWPAVQGAVAYDVEWKKDSGNWIRLQRVGTTSVDVTGIYAGAYLARARAVSAFEITSIWRSSMLTELKGKEGVPPAVTHLTTESLLFAIKVTWGLPAGAEDTERTELWYSEGIDLEQATKLADLAYPQAEHVLQGLRGGQQFFFWARLVDRTGNVGPFFPVAPTVVSGRSSIDAGPILEQITGEILESHLGQELTDRIDLIDKDGPGSVNDRLGEVRSDLNEQLVDVNNRVGEVQSELQQQIDGIADLADSMPYKPEQTYTIGQSVLGEDGRLYQAKVAVPAGTPPPNTTYWTDIGQAVQTANGLAARVGTVETTVTELNGDIDAQAQQIDGLRTSINGKADASTVSGLSSRVSQNEQGLQSQGQAITGVQNGLTATNQNVTAAQQAAQSASDAAGAKGKVLYQSSAPAVADRLAQNLWIDTTGNANTPKRWSGSAWVAVTDKVATDAAAAAATALTQVATKADASTVQSLSNTVSQHGQEITAAGQAITNINTSLTQVGGENLLYNPSLDVVSASTAWLPDGWSLQYPGATLTSVFVASTLDPSGKALRLGMTLPNASSYADLVQDTSKWPGVSEGQVLTISGHFRATDGLIAQLYFQWRDASGANISTDGASSQNASIAPEAWQRFSRISAPAPAGTVSVRIILRIRGPISGTSITGWCEWDRLQLEQGAVMTGWRDNGRVNAAEIATTAAATSALTGRVAANESGLTSASGQLTELNNAIGDVGGENLFYNPGFSKYASLTGVPDGWETEGPVTSTDTLVASWLNSGEKAVRMDVIGVNSSSSFKSLRPVAAKRLKVAAGQTVTASVYVRRGVNDVRMRFFIQWINASGAVINAPNSALLLLTTAGTRERFSAVAPDGAAVAYVYFRIYGGGATAVDGRVEFARPQAEYGSRVSGWKDNGQVNGDAVSAASAAVDGLSSIVSQQGRDITSVSARATTLENSVNSTADGLSTKASTSALNSVSGRVSAAESGLTAQAGSISNLEAKIGAAQAFVAGQTWEFTGSTQGWRANSTGATITAGPLFATVSKYTTIQATSSFPSIDGAENPLIRIRLRRRNTGRTSAAMYWANEDGGLAEARRFNWPISTSNGDWQDIEFDLSGHAGWNGKKIWAIRLDMYNSGDANGEVDIAYIAAGRRSVAASGRAVDSLSVNVTQQGEKLEAETQRINGLQTAVGNNTASVQQVSTAQSALDDKVGASYSVKLQVASGGRYAVSGLGIGIENNGGVLQSTFAVMADRFAVLNPSGSGFISPFAIQNGQVFMNDALISKLAVSNALVGSTISSVAMTNWGGPVMSMDFNSGTIILRHPTNTYTQVHINKDGIQVYVGGSIRVRMGVW